MLKRMILLFTLIFYIATPVVEAVPSSDVPTLSDLLGTDVSAQFDQSVKEIVKKLKTLSKDKQGLIINLLGIPFELLELVSKYGQDSAQDMQEMAQQAEKFHHTMKEFQKHCEPVMEIFNDIQATIEKTMPKELVENAYKFNEESMKLYEKYANKSKEGLQSKEFHEQFRKLEEKYGASAMQIQLINLICSLKIYTEAYTTFEKINRDILQKRYDETGYLMPIKRTKYVMHPQKAASSVHMLVQKAIEASTAAK